MSEANRTAWPEGLAQVGHTGHGLFLDGGVVVRRPLQSEADRVNWTPSALLNRSATAAQANPPGVDQGRHGCIHSLTPSLNFVTTRSRSPDAVRRPAPYTRSHTRGGGPTPERAHRHHWANRKPTG